MKVLVFTYLIVALPAFLFFPKDRKPDYFYTNSFVFALFSTLMALIELGNISIAIYGGFFWESSNSIVYDHYQLLLYNLEKIVRAVAIILPILNFSKNYRQKFSLQLTILFLYLCYFIIDAAIYGITPGISIVPGWHTTILPWERTEFYIFVFILTLLGNFLLLKYKWLPEFMQDDIVDMHQ